MKNTHGPVNYSTLSEADIRADIQHFRDCLTTLDAQPQKTKHGTPKARRTLYEVLVHQRCQLLAALHDGRPENWPDYEPVNFREL